MPAADSRRFDAALPAWAVFCFILSGAAGLLYEMVWTKQLGYLLGNSLHATATVVAAFLGGLALGARFLGPPLSRRGDGARYYALLELGVVGFGLAWLPLLRSLDPVVGAAYRALGGEGAAFAAVRFALLFVVLVPPAAVMGATLPVLVAHFERRVVGAGLARLYAWNTFGAVLGSLAGGFVLMPAIGLAATTWVAAAANALVAAVAWRAGAPGPAVAASAALQSTAAPHIAARPGLSPARWRALAIAFGLSGFAALAFQIAWVRLFGMMFGSSVYSFAAVLAVYLSGLAIGSLAVVPWVQRGATLGQFATLQLALAMVTALVLHTFRWLPEWMLRLADAAGPRWGLLLGGEIAIAALLVLVPCVLLGAAFPVATQLLQREDTGHAIGFAYAVNTLGTITGSVTAGFLLVPRLGVQGTHVAALSLAAAIGLAAVVIDPAAGARRRALATGVVVATALIAAAAPGWDASLMAAGPFRPIQATLLGLRAQEGGAVGPAVARATRGLRLLLHREGIHGSVVVEENPETGNRLMRVGGKVDASLQDNETQVLLGAIPGACADSGARAAIVGLGSGSTLAAALAAGAGTTDVIELEPAVVEASRFFHLPGADPLDDPRTRLILGDARTHFAHDATRYGLVVSQPSNPWVAGENALFTVEFYRLVRARLEADGVFCQWAHSYELSAESFEALVGAFLAVFPQGHAFVVWESGDVLLIAMPPERMLALDRLRSPAARALLAQAGIAAPEDIAGRYAGSFETMRAAAGRTLNRDDLPIVEYRAPRDLVQIGRGGGGAVPVIPFQTAPPGGALFAAWTPAAWVEARVRALAAGGQWERAARAATGARDIGRNDLAAELAAEVESGRRRAAIDAETARANEFEAAGRTAEALGALERAARIDSMDVSGWLRLAVARRRAHDGDGAARALANVGMPTEPRVRAEAELMAGLLAIDRRDPRAAAARFREAQRWDRTRGAAYLFEARSLEGTGDFAGARAAIERGLTHCPGDSDLVAAAAALRAAAAR